ncbi:MAG: V-type ATP synthase subunit E [Nitrosopumilus sp.]|jgi:V/A-type H+-transporting ATPase subunit E|nr:V-type ATP synthase subunit E [Nitrosopumilus sp.]MBT3574036.1 V-type ATP synthase subunit E [Nitrosopumilus sp.]MBT3956681.1 V-type ATP synthase subunit E [Nitrosopumilus sp.]MBT4298455.1 V-type ATP synthase subunit E [Nitrosopumilus sp.]MBT4535778.1 V-type ATP synthase subunit E [Nitrosopumilus sp.]
MGRRVVLTTNLALEGTIDKILKNTENDVLSSLKSALDDSQQSLDDSITKLESEYDKIVSDGKKEADKIEKQIVGGSDIEARNKQLLALESSVDRVFTTALEQISNSDRTGDYANLIKSLLDESTKVLGTSEVIVFTNSKDKDTVQSTLSSFPGSELSSETIDCLGGVKIQSKDGSMKFDNTIDARIERLKPLIRKEIASKFGVKE